MGVPPEELEVGIGYVRGTGEAHSVLIWNGMVFDNNTDEVKHIDDVEYASFGSRIPWTVFNS